MKGFSISIRNRLINVLLSHDKDKEPSYHQALKGNGQQVIDERYKYLENLPKDRLRVWLDSYDLYKEAKNSVTYAIRPASDPQDAEIVR